MALGGTADPTMYPVGRYKFSSGFDVFQLDPDGAALKTTNFVLTAQNLVSRSLKPGTHGDVAYPTGDRQPVAALRSGGLGVSRHGRAGLVAIEAAGATLKNAALEASAATTRKVVLFTEDLLRGYRVDVQHLGVMPAHEVLDRAQAADIAAIPSGLQGHEIGFGRGDKTFHVKTSGYTPSLVATQSRTNHGSAGSGSR
jgi:hypothetical protein